MLKLKAHLSPVYLLRLLDSPSIALQRGRSGWVVVAAGWVVGAFVVASVRGGDGPQVTIANPPNVVTLVVASQHRVMDDGKPLHRRNSKH